MALFENFNDDLETNADQKISFTERTIIIAIVGLGYIFLRKGRKAKTYGDLYKLFKLVGMKAKKFEDDMNAKYGKDGDVPEEDEEKWANRISSDAEVLTQEIENS